MVLEHAPATCLTLIFSSISTVVTRERYCKGARKAGGGGGGGLLQHQQQKTLWGTVRRLPLHSIPFGPLGCSLHDIVLAASVIYQMRALERRWGTNTFLSFLLNSAALGVLAVFLLATESSTTVLPVETVRVLSASGSLVPLVALATRYTVEVPSLSSLSMRVPGTNISLTEKALFILPLIKLVLWPDGEIVAGTHKRRAVMVDVGLWARLLLAVVGILFAIASTRSGPLVLWLRAFSQYVCRPITNFLCPLFTALTGPTNVVEHAVPKHMQEQQQQGGDYMGRYQEAGPVVGDGGRYVVDSLTGGGGMPAREALRRRRTQQPQQQQGADAPEVNPALILQVAELGLDVSREEIVNALIATGGDVNAAVHLIIGGGQH